MLDYDLLASANYIRGIYDGDGDDPPEDPTSRTRRCRPAPAVEDVFDDGFKSQGMKSERGAFDGRSDYVGFTAARDPGRRRVRRSRGVQTPRQEAIYGGAAGPLTTWGHHHTCGAPESVISLASRRLLPADGLAFYVDDATDADRQAAPRSKMAGGALAQPDVSSDGAAAYSVWYFATARDPFGAGARVRAARRRAARVQARRAGFRWQGPVRLRR